MTILNLLCYSNSEADKVIQKRGYISKFTFSFITVYNYSILNSCNLDEFKKSVRNKIQFYTNLNIENINIVKKYFKNAYTNQKVVNKKWFFGQLEKIFLFLKKLDNIENCIDKFDKKNFMKIHSNDLGIRYFRELNNKFIPKFSPKTSKKTQYIQELTPNEFNKVENYSNRTNCQIIRSRSLPAKNIIFENFCKFNILNNLGQKTQLKPASNNEIKLNFTKFKKSNSFFSLNQNKFYFENFTNKLYLMKSNKINANNSINNVLINKNKNAFYENSIKNNFQKENRQINNSLSNNCPGKKLLFNANKEIIRKIGVEEISKKGGIPEFKEELLGSKQETIYQKGIFENNMSNFNNFKVFSSTPRIILNGPYEYKSQIKI